MELSIWNKKVQRLILSEDDSSLLLAFALLGREKWSVWIWKCLPLGTYTYETFHLPAPLRREGIWDLMSKYYNMKGLLREAKSKWKTIGWEDYITKSYKFYYAAHNMA